MESGLGSALVQADAFKSSAIFKILKSKLCVVALLQANTTDTITINPDSSAIIKRAPPRLRIVSISQPDRVRKEEIITGVKPNQIWQSAQKLGRLDLKIPIELGTKTRN